MIGSGLLQLVWGAVAMACWIAGLFFLRIWRSSGDRLFLFFFLAFWALAVNWIALGLMGGDQESQPWIFGVRLLAFALILVGVVDKNRRGEDRLRR